MIKIAIIINKFFLMDINGNTIKQNLYKHPNQPRSK